PAGLSTEPTEFDTLANMCTGLQFSSAALRIACAANFGADSLKKTSAPVDLSVTISESTVGSDFVRRLTNNLHLAGKSIRQPLQIILAGIVVLIEDGNFSTGMIGQEIFREDAPFSLISWLPTHRPREMLRITEFVSACRHKKVRDLLCIHVFLNRRIRCSPEALKY